MKFNNINVYIGENVHLGKNVKIGDNTSIYDNVTIDDNTIVSSNCLIGEPTSEYYSSKAYINKSVYIGANSIIRSNTIIYAGVNAGEGLQTGHHTMVRENNILGRNCVVGMYCNILPDCIIGDYVHFHSYDSISEGSVIEDYAYLFPFITLTADPTPPSDNWQACKIGMFTVIAANSLLLPGTEIGKHCLIAAQSKVGGKFEDFSFISGSPARRIMDIRKAPIINKGTKKLQYPWPYNFNRGMPWAGKGFDVWLKENNMTL